MRDLNRVALALMASVLLFVGVHQALASAATAPALLSKLPVAAERDGGYDRDEFNHWTTVPGKGCDTREWVLYRQNRSRPRSCGDERGSWVSVYDGLRFKASSKLDVDHMVPLAEAWGSGARRWTSRQREAFANDLFRFSLIAVSLSSNRSKSDQDPADWLPPTKGFVCRYVARWTAVKYRWKLSVDPREKRSLARSFENCSSASVQVGNVPRAKVKNTPSGGGGGAKLDPRFDSCSAAIDAGYGPYVRGVDPEYTWYEDRDGDGRVCES